MASAQEGGKITGENSCTLQQRSSSMSVGRFSSHDRQTPSSNNEVDARKEKRRRSWLDIIKLKGRKKSKKSVLSKSMSEAKVNSIGVILVVAEKYMSAVLTNFNFLFDTT